MHPINITACVLMASLGSTVRPTLMNACRRLVFMGGTIFFFTINYKNNANCQKRCEIIFIAVFSSRVSGHIQCITRFKKLMAAFIGCLRKLQSFIPLKGKIHSLKRKNAKGLLHGIKQNPAKCMTHVCSGLLSCNDGIDSYSCLCQRGWTSSRCEVNIDVS